MSFPESVFDREKVTSATKFAQASKKQEENPFNRF